MMDYRTLGKTGIRVSVVTFGAGPVSGWMAELSADEQCAVIRRALDVGINWFDTAAGYGHGLSESSLGRAFARLGFPDGAHVATKVRYPEERLSDIRGYTRESVRASLARLGLRRVTLLQLHNSITARRGDEPTSLTPADVLGRGGVLDAFRELQSDGLVGVLGLTGIGQPGSLRAVVDSGAYDTIQVPFNALNPSAGYPMPAGSVETDYGNIIADCATQKMGVFAIRVFAGGALLGAAPSAHTLKTPFFPFDLYERDRQRAARLRMQCSAGADLASLGLHFVLGHPHVTAAIIGFRTAAELDAVVRAGIVPPPAKVLNRMLQAASTPLHDPGTDPAT